MSDWVTVTAKEPQPLYQTRKLPHGVICLFTDGPTRWTAHLTASAAYDADTTDTAQHIATERLLDHLRLLVTDLEALAGDVDEALDVACKKVAALETELGYYQALVEALRDYAPCVQDGEGACAVHGSLGVEDCPHGIARDVQPDDFYDGEPLDLRAWADEHLAKKGEGEGG